MFYYTLFSSVLWMVVVMTCALLEPNGTITVCHLKLQNNIEITGTICPLPMGCFIHPTPASEDITALPGTKIRYKCINSFPEEESSIDITTTCEGQRWVPPILQCDQLITMQKPNPDWSNPTLWKSPIFPSKCGMSTIETDSFKPSVWSGNTVKLGEFPWHAGVYESKGEKSRKPICGATIIASQYLLSAAHCFTEMTNTANMRNHTEFYIMVGKLKSRNDVTENYQQRHEITHIILNAYRGHDYRYQSDIAVIRTKSEITFNSNVSPICMINDYFPHISENTDLWVAGWGYFNASQIQSEDLLSIKLPYISYKECSNNPNYKEASTYLTIEKFCTVRDASMGKSLDIGDSGGGLVTKGPNNTYYLIGIVSLWQNDSPIAMCTYVPQFHKWIFETTLYYYIIHLLYNNSPENGTMAAKPRKITGCHLKLQNDINITKVICPLSYMGCMIDPTSSSEDKIALPGTKIRYKCINSSPGKESKATNLTTCKGHKWLPRIPRCDQFITTSKPNPDRSNLTLWTLPVFTHECGKSDMFRPLVQNGKIATLGKFPWYAGVYNSEGERRSEPICGATIIASRYLLSAAHCFTEETNTAIMRNHTEFYIIVGKLKSRYDITESSQQRHNITHIFTKGYRGRDFRYQNDVAVIRTKSKITFNSNVSPICMINDHFPRIKENAKLRVAGWGLFNDSNVQSEDLRWTELPYISYEKCSSNPKYSSEVSTLLTTEKFCTTRGEGTEKSLDKGDSGGGLVTIGPKDAYYLIGIVSVSKEEGRHIFMCTDVQHFHKWIFETMSKYYIDLNPEEQSTSDENLHENGTPVCGQLSQTTKTSATAGTNSVLPGEFPWHANIYKRYLICGATIISSYTLLSAAHCFYDQRNNSPRSPAEYRIGVGEIGVDQDLSVYEPSRIYEVESLIFKNYGLQHVRDIVIIVIKTEISFNSQVSPICMFQDSSLSLASNELLQVVNWNLNREPLFTVEHQPYISFDDCYKITPPSELSYLENDKFCSRTNETASPWTRMYHGGSGLVRKNPADFAYYLVGIELWKVNESSIVLNTDVSTYLPWIHEKLDQIHKAKNEIFSG